MNFRIDEKSIWKKLRPEQAKEMERDGSSEAMSTPDMNGFLADDGEDTFMDAEVADS